jgi:hypothetical protein
LMKGCLNTGAACIIDVSYTHLTRTTS